MQSGDHLHDLNLAVRLTSVNVASVGDQELDELAGRWGWKQGRVVLLGENESLVSHDNAVLIRQVLHVRRVGEAFDGDEQLAWEIKTLGNFFPKPRSHCTLANRWHNSGGIFIFLNSPSNACFLILLFTNDLTWSCG